MSIKDVIWDWAMYELIVLILGFGLVIWQIYLHRQKNMIDAILSLDAKWKSERMLDCRIKACKQYRLGSQGINYEETEILGFFEDLGIFLKRKVIDRKLLWDKYSYYATYYWSMYVREIYKFRSQEKDNTWFERFQYLNEEMNNISFKKCLSDKQKTEKEIEKFIKGEINRAKFIEE